MLVWLAWLSWRCWCPWSPIPPFFFVSHSRLQFIRCILFSLPVWPHQYLVMMELISLHNPFGSLNKLIEYVGIACATVLISTSLPALEMNFSFTPWLALLFFPEGPWRNSSYSPPPPIGKPRYFSNSVTIQAFSMLRMLSFIVMSVLGLKNKAIFCRLIA